MINLYDVKVSLITEKHLLNKVVMTNDTNRYLFSTVSSQEMRNGYRKTMWCEKEAHNYCKPLQTIGEAVFCIWWEGYLLRTSSDE